MKMFRMRQSGLLHPPPLFFKKKVRNNTTTFLEVVVFNVAQNVPKSVEAKRRKN